MKTEDEKIVEFQEWRKKQPDAYVIGTIRLEEVARFVIEREKEARQSEREKTAKEIFDDLGDVIPEGWQKTPQYKELKQKWCEKSIEENNSSDAPKGASKKM